MALERLGPRHPGDGAVGHAARQLEHAGGEGRQQDRAGRRLGHRHLALGLYGVALEGHLLTAEQRQQHRQVLAHVPGRLVEAVPVHVLDDDLVRQPDAERQPARAGRQRRGQCLLRQHRRMPRVGGDDGRAELDARHLAAGYRQRGQRLEPEDVGHPDRREPVVGRPADLIGQFDQCLVAARLGRRDTDPHALSPSARRQLRCRRSRDLILAAAYPIRKPS